MTHELKLELDEEWMSPAWLAANLRGRAGFMESTTGGSDRETAEGLRKLAASIEEQVKPAVDEPTEFGSVISATCGGERMRWQQAQDVGYHYWRSITGVVEVWSELTDVEVLRVGLDESTPQADAAPASRTMRVCISDVAPCGEQDCNSCFPLTASDLSRMSVEAHQAKLNGEATAYREGEAFGQKLMNGKIHVRLRELLADAITSERKNAYEKAIQAVEELAP